MYIYTQLLWQRNTPLYTLMHMRMHKQLAHGIRKGMKSNVLTIKNADLETSELKEEEPI